MRRFRLFLLGCAVAASSGCAGYKLGPSNGQAAGAKSVQIIPFTNQTIEPRVGDAVTAAMRKQMQHDGTYRLATHDDGDIVVNGVITQYHRYAMGFLPSDVTTVSDYRVTVTAQVTARDRATGNVILDRPVTGFTLVRVGNDLTSAERQALPLLADDLARNATELLVQGGW